MISHSRFKAKTSNMAATRFPTTQYTATNLTESCGAVLFEPQSKRICLLRYNVNGEVYLPKGRRNIGESRHAAALREVAEETGYECDLIPLNMENRQPATDADVDMPDAVTRHADVSTEPFMCTVRDVGNGGVKLIWWFIACSTLSTRGPGEAQFGVEICSYQDAIEALTFETDRAVLRRAIEVLELSQAR